MGARGFNSRNSLDGQCAWTYSFFISYKPQPVKAAPQKAPVQFGLGIYADVAQRDRARSFQVRGCGFDPDQPHHTTPDRCEPAHTPCFNLFGVYGNVAKWLCSRFLICTTLVRFQSFPPPYFIHEPEQGGDPIIKLVKVYCPDCGRWLMMADRKASGTVAPYCKSCRCNKIIKLVPSADELPDKKR